MKRITPEFEIEMPDNSLIGDFVCLSDILDAGFKVPEYDEGHKNEPQPVFSAHTPILDYGKYQLVSPQRAFLSAGLYNGYTDEPTIIFRESDSRILYIIPKENEWVAMITFGLEGLMLKPSTKDKFELEYVYIMMKAGEFNNQFKQGIKTKNLLKGLIPMASLDVQRKIIDDNRRSHLKEYFKN